MSRRVELAIALAIGVLVVAIRAPLMDLPLERDEGEYAYIGWRLAHDEIPYLDWFDQKPPATFLAYRLALALPGDEVVAIRIVAAGFAALSSIALFFLVSSLLGAKAAVLASLLLGLLSADPLIQGPMANAEIFMLPGMVAAAALFLRGIRAAKPATMTFVAVGFLLGIATTFKQVAAVNGLFFLLLFPIAVPGPDRWRRFLHFCGCAGLGGLLVWAPLLVWFQVHGGLRETLDAILLHNIDYASALPLSRRLSHGCRVAALRVATLGARLAQGPRRLRQRNHTPAFSHRTAALLGAGPWRGQQTHLPPQQLRSHAVRGA